MLLSEFLCLLMWSWRGSLWHLVALCLWEMSQPGAAKVRNVGLLSPES